MSNLGWTSPDGTFYIFNGPDTNCTAVCPIEYSVYGYRPSLALSGALIGLYSLCIMIQVAQGVYYQTWGFMTAMLLGCLDEILGYVGRIMYWRNPFAQPGFIMQIVLITMGPVFFSAAIYVMLSKIVLYICPRSSRFPPNFFYYIFLPADILSLILQAIGGALSSTSNGASTAGVNIALAGLSLQVATLFFFVVAVADYFVRSRGVWSRVQWPREFTVFIAGLGLATLTIWIRCCYRVYELSEGYSSDSEALRNEGEFIGLESVMIIVAAYALTVAHPGRVFKQGATLTGTSETETQAHNQTETEMGVQEPKSSAHASGGFSTTATEA